ncbi:MAG TPA: glycosyltransferase family 2 protein [Allosphingosinicella sp.]|jgi:GT2 family glycosyltransferase
MRLSVIVPVYNGLSFLPAFFDSLAAAALPETQLILVDDGSSERVSEVFPSGSPYREVVRIRNPMNLGYSAAVNRGFEAADGDIVIQLNTDLILHSDCLEKLVAWIDGTPNVGIVGSKLIFPTTGRVQHIGMAFGALSWCHVYFDMAADHPLCRRTRKMQIVTGATVAMSRPVLQAVGPLDERYYNCNEDIDHCLEAVKLGYDNYTVADSVAYHWVSQSGPPRFSGIEEADALFWIKWSGARQVDIGDYIDEALDYVLDQRPELAGYPFAPLNLSTTRDDEIFLDRIDRRWSGALARTVHRRTHSLGKGPLLLPMLLPHRAVLEPIPYIYFVNGCADLASNRLWFENRLRTVGEEIIADSTGAIFTASEFLAERIPV